MNKKCVLVLDDRSQPIGVLEIKDYTPNELKFVTAKCEENKKEYDERVALEKKLLLKELEIKDQQIAELKERLELCEQNIKLLLGEE